MILHSLLGSKSGPKRLTIEKESIRTFVANHGDVNPLFYDDEVARANGFAHILAPPAFPATFDLPIAKLHSMPSTSKVIEQRFTYLRPLVSEEQIICTNEVIDVYDCEDRTMGAFIVVTQLVGDDLNGNLIFTFQSKYHIVP